MSNKSSPPFRKVLIANRGEVAVRVIRACHELGISTVAVHSTADAEALHVKLAQESVCIGAPVATESYLNISAIVSAAVATGAQAIHPGYGFLSENAGFAEICEHCGIRFIGPTVRNMKMMGDKAVARRLANKVGVPVIPGSQEAGTNPEKALREAEKIGFPVLIKASAGGGGRGMQVIEKAEQFVPAFKRSMQEVGAAFGDPSLYVEKFIQNPRHVEVQIVGDKFGNLIHLGERDCSMQRRYQKLLEETPAYGLEESLIAEMREAAVSLAKAIDYASLGTIEFLVDSVTKEYFFIEMNTRLQVEHPVTEMVTLTDIVKQQIWVAADKELSIKQSDVKIIGHAIEARINAENPVTQMPSPGRVEGFHPPGGPGVRVDSALYDRYFVPPYYDSLVAKIIVRGENREEAINKLLVALDECIIDGIHTNMSLQRAILNNEEFRQGRVHTNLLQSILESTEENEDD